MSGDRIGALVRCHNRPRTLDIVLRELDRYRTFAGVDVAISVMADRPTQEVLAVLKRHDLAILTQPKLNFPLLSHHGERFMEALNIQLEDLEKAAHPDFLLLADDDRWFEPLRIAEELPAVLANPDIDLWYARSIFFQDDPHTFNTRRHHYSPVLCRLIPGDRFPLTRIIQAPERSHDRAIVQDRVGAFKTPLLDYGSFRESDRLRLYKAFVAAGKSDPYVDSLLGPASPHTFPEDAHRLGLLTAGPWKDLWSEYGA